MNDSSIVDLFLARDETAISETANKYGARLRRVALGVVRDEGAADECVNDTYLAAWNLIPPNEPREHLFPFLGRTARHIAIDDCRRRSAAKRSAAVVELTREIAETIPATDSTEGALEAREFARLVSEFLWKQGGDKRRVFVRRYWYFDSIAEISAATGFSESKVKSMLLRMRRQLGEYLKERWTEDE